MTPLIEPETPISDPGAHRITNPVRTLSDVPNPYQGLGVDTSVLDYAAKIQSDFMDLEVHPAHRAWVSANLSLRRFYTAWMAPDHLRRVESGQLAISTVKKTTQALSRWEKITKPADWHHPQEWPGVPIGAITDRYLTWVMDRLRKTLSPSTCQSTWNHLRTILNFATRVRAIETAPRPEPFAIPTGEVILFTDEQLTRAYRALESVPDLQVSLVLAVNTGMRPVDLFGLRWSDVTLGDRPQVEFTAKKTGKRQTIPLGRVTVRQLQRLPGQPGEPLLLFPARSNPTHTDPEKSRQARRRRKDFKEALAAVSLHFDKPYQSLRATCNERLERFREGVGQFVLGHANTLNSKSYRNPAQAIRDAIEQLPQPPCFDVF